MHPCQMNHHEDKSENNTQHAVTRREFIQTAGMVSAGLILASCQPKSAATTAAPAQSDSTPAAEVKPAAAKPIVAIAKAASYDPALVKKQVQAMFEGIGGIQDVLAHGNRVAIKVNLTGGVKSGSLPGVSPTESFLTHPTVVKAVIELLRDAGAKDIFIVESVYEKESWPTYGYEQMAKETGVKLVDLNSPAPYKDYAVTPVPNNPFIYESFKFNPILNEIDALVSISKMKCHNTAGVTHTMKNLFGLAPARFYILNPGDNYRSGFHGPSGETAKRLPQVIMDLNRARPVNLSVIDGILTTEAGEGPWIPAMTPIKPGVMFAGKNPVATDSVATLAMGFDPTAEYPKEPFVHANNHLNIAAKLGLGTNKIDEIQVVGATIDEVKKQFKVSY